MGRKLELSESELRFLRAVLCEGRDDLEFHLSEDTRLALLELYNLKLTPTLDKVICYQGHDLSKASEANSSGLALAFFLRTQAFATTTSDLAEDLENFLTRKE